MNAAPRGYHGASGGGSANPATALVGKRSYQRAIGEAPLRTVQEPLGDPACSASGALRSRAARRCWREASLT